jgi:hypothetical protein
MDDHLTGPMRVEPRIEPLAQASPRSNHQDPRQ